jgi:hypothetical protein
MFLRSNLVIHARADGDANDARGGAFRETAKKSLAQFEDEGTLSVGVFALLCASVHQCGYRIRLQSVYMRE